MKKYITYNKNNKHVIGLFDKKPMSYSDNLDVAVIELQALPKDYDYLTFENNQLIKHRITKTQDELLSANRLKYELEVERLIRLKYSISQEFALLRQKTTKPDEYAVYYNYCEECKNKAKGV